MFNIFFTSIATNIQNTIQPLNALEKSKLDDLTDEPSRLSSTTFSFHDISYDELKILVNEIDSYKSSGFELISSKLTKITFKISIKHFRFILNLAIRTSIFPDRWKETIVTSLHKSGPKNNTNN